jgi:orotate phosphoribosyltransferase
VTEGLAAEIWRAGLLKFGKFKLTSGLESPYYIDLRLAPSYPKLFEEIADELVNAITENAGEFDKVAGVELAGIPLSTLVAYKLRRPLVYVRKSRKEHGTGGRVEGVLKRGDKIILVDDVLTTGGTLASAVLALRDEGASVEETVVFVDRMQGGVDELGRLGVKVIKVYDVLSLFSELFEIGLIDLESLEEVRAYTRSAKL